LLAAYEVSPERYRKKFSEIKKSDSENFAEFAFKMQNFFKCWLQSIDSYEDIDELRQTLMIEQFLQTVSVELKIWLVDQKPKTVDEMARLADQYVALRKQATSTQQQPTETKKFVAHNTDTTQRAQTHFKQHSYTRRSPSQHRKQFAQHKPQAAATTTKRVLCEFCKNRVIQLANAECEKTKKKTKCQVQALTLRVLWHKLNRLSLTLKRWRTQTR